MNIILGIYFNSPMIGIVSLRAHVKPVYSLYVLDRAILVYNDYFQEIGQPL